MNIKLINRGQEGELVLEGRLDTLTAPEAEEVFNQMAERFEKIVLNMMTWCGAMEDGTTTRRYLRRAAPAIRKKTWPPR